MKIKTLLGIAVVVALTYFATKQFYYYQLSTGQAGVACMVGSK